MAKKDRMEIVTGTVLMAAVIVLLLLCIIVPRAQGATPVMSRIEGTSSLKVTIDGISESEGPEIDGQTVDFRYPDDGFESVYLLVDFNDWQPLEMVLDESGSFWSLPIDLDKGLHRYQFQVSDGDETWTALDPDNSNAATYRDRGWISFVTVGRSHYEHRGRSRLRHRHTAGPLLSREMNRIYGDEDGGVAFNRVDGFSVFIEPGTHTGDAMGPLLKSRISYGFASKEWTLDGTFLQPLLKNHRAMLRLGAHTGTDYSENTGLSDLENTLAAAFFKEDFRDYYKRDGLIGSLILLPGDKLRLEAGFRADDYLSLVNHTNWSFADGDFLPNPAVQEGLMHSLFTSVRLGTPLNHVNLEYEKSDSEDLGGDFDFTRLTTSLRSRLNLGRTQRVDFHLKYGTALTGDLPNQKRFAMGGIGTVRGYAYQSLLDRDPALVLDPTILGYRGGQRMLQMNIEYGMALGWDGWDGLIELENWDEWDDEDIDLSGIGRFDGMLYIFMDSGMAWEDRHADVSFSETESSIGIGYRFGDDGLRVDVARPLDSEEHDPIFQLRLNRMF